MINRKTTTPVKYSFGTTGGLNLSLSLALKDVSVGEFRMSISSLFHSFIEEGITDLEYISVRLMID